MNHCTVGEILNLARQLDSRGFLDSFPRKNPSWQDPSDLFGSGQSASFEELLPAMCVVVVRWWLTHPINCQVFFWMCLPFSKQFTGTISQMVMCNKPSGESGYERLIVNEKITTLQWCTHSHKMLFFSNPFHIRVSESVFWYHFNFWSCVRLFFFFSFFFQFVKEE